MQTVELVRARPGVQKVSCTRTLQALCGLGLSEAKAKTDALLAHKHPIVALSSQVAARGLIVSLASLGVVARFSEGEDYNPQDRLDVALAQIESRLSPASIVNCRALAAHGEWELALSHCLSALSSQSAELPKEVIILFGELVIEFGLAEEGPLENGA